MTFKEIDKEYINKDNSTNIYMIMVSMQCLLDEKKSKEFENQINNEINILKNKINSIDINIILYLMGLFKNK